MIKKAENFKIKMILEAKFKIKMIKKGSKFQNKKAVQIQSYWNSIGIQSEFNRNSIVLKLRRK